MEVSLRLVKGVGGSSSCTILLSDLFECVLFSLVNMMHFDIYCGFVF